MEIREIDDSVLLWNNFRNGNDDAYILIYRKYVQSLYFQGLQITQNKELIKDCIQDVFTKLYKYRSSLGNTDNVKFYLLASMRNQLLTILSKEKRYMDIDMESSNADKSNEQNVEDILIEQENDIALNDKVNSIMSLLTDRQREAIRYRYIECLSTEEICILMDLNYQSLQNILTRSLKKIRQHYKKKSFE
ncbi:MAG: RNA polymerase sigma factor [Dysgonomonas sp.]